MDTEQQSQQTQSGGEFEREPVPEKAHKGAGAFWGMYAGEHTAGTEFMLGPLFVSWGVGAFDLLVGLLVGNLLAVLSWRFVTAPIATKYRLTLYYQLERICGRDLVVLYNLANGVLFCFLAGAMVTVSATAIGAALPNINMPTFQDTMPTGLAWCVAVVILGAMMTFVAIKGYGVVARVGQLASPWMFLIFLACGIVMLGRLGSVNLMELLTPAEGTQAKIGFWGVVFFSWFCNAAMHIGMSDLSVLRFARKPSYGWASSAGMFLGHYVAWICAALLLVYWVRAKGASPVDGVPPGPMVWDAVGWTGLICVIIAGWTTANPTLYRAGLAFQGLYPKMSRATATLIAGSLCTLAGMFPAVAMRLLDFVGLYGTTLAPVGAVILAEVYLAKRFGLTNDWAVTTGRSFNLAVLLAWAIPLAVFYYLYFAGTVSFPSYMTLPVYIATGVLYLVLAKMMNRVPAVMMERAPAATS
jgi:NCS1 family nucleobase:cation symporter-1